MSNLKDLQHDFINYLCDKPSTLATAVVDQKPVPIDTRLHIYKNAYRERLKEVLAVDHEILSAYLGHELFDQMAYGYIAAHPSTFTSLRQFADALPQYLRAASPFIDVPMLAELATFERTLLQVFDAADVKVKNFSDLRSLDPQFWPNMRLRFHPSLQIKHFNWNVIPVWQALKAEKTPPGRQQAMSIWVLWRGSDRLSSFLSIEPDEEGALKAFLQGSNFAEVCELLNKWHAAEMIGEVAIGLLRKWFDMGLIREIVA